ncbi:MAG TPA: ribonuclease Y [Candidatus Gracilibacteria bacterium]
MEPITIIIGLVALVVGGGASYAVARPKSKAIEAKTQEETQRALEAAKKEAQSIVSESRSQAENLRQSAKREEEQLRARLLKLEEQADERIAKKEEQLELKREKLEESREKYEQSSRALEEQRKQLEVRLSEQNEALEKVAKLSQKEAKEKLLTQIEEQCSDQMAEAMRRKMEEIRRGADEEASNVIVESIQRYASSVTGESTVSVVKIESDDIKGKIIGREGRNINAFETITGTDLIIDDTPGTITISCFDLYRRYVAKLALEELIKDGRIHPSKIEEVVDKAQASADKMLLELGRRASQELGITGFPDQILKLVGRLRFRTSYGQNVLQHSMEVAFLAEAIATALPGADPEICKKAGLVHDIGKAVSHEVEGGHAVIGKDILEKFGVSTPIITAMKSHHEDFPYESIEARVLQAADAISASRPGARRETLEKYIKRLKELEAIALSFEGVDKVFAIQAGREVRVFVNADVMNDLASEKLSFEIARKIESNCQYPGEVRVAIIRETRFENIAK